MKHLGFLLLILSTYTHAKILTSLKAQLYQNGYPLKKCEVNIIAPSWAVLSTHCRLGESRDSFNQNFYITDRNHRIYYIQDHYFHSDFFSEEVRTFQDTAYLQDLFFKDPTGVTAPISLRLFSMIFKILVILCSSKFNHSFIM